MTKNTKAKRNIFVELMESIGTMTEQRTDKATLKTHTLPVADPFGNRGKRPVTTKRVSRLKAPSC
jgi:hypothetical protein